MNTTPTHFVALRRDGKTPSDWKSEVEHTDGVVVLSSTGRFMSIIASDAAVAEIGRTLGHDVYIEPVAVREHV